MTEPRSTGRTPRSTLAAALSVLLLGIAVIVAFRLVGGSPADDPAAPVPADRAASSSTAAAATGVGDGRQAPRRVLNTLALIDAGQWPEAANAPGTRGGGRFGNYEGLLPETGAGGRAIGYTEWDVNPKKSGRGRDAERIVTGDDGSAWYTLDHYRTFVQIRGPSR